MSTSGAGGPGHGGDARAEEGAAPGTLYVVATPIGNLADMSARACAVLAGVDAVLAEDTRHTGRLLRHHGIEARLESLHEHNERRRVPKLLERLLAGESFALVCDAGTPLVSDPGYLLVESFARAGGTLAPVPGPSAFLCALSVAGLPTDRFAFEGFLPSAPGARAARLEALADDPRSLVFHEAPHRVAAALEAMRAAFGDGRRVVLARELTKRHESIVRTTLGEAAERLGEPRGEYVIVAAGRAKREAGELTAQAERTLGVLLEALPLRQAVDLSVRITGAPRKPLYRLALARRRTGEGEEGGADGAPPATGGGCGEGG